MFKNKYLIIYLVINLLFIFNSFYFNIINPIISVIIYFYILHFYKNNNLKINFIYIFFILIIISILSYIYLIIKFCFINNPFLYKLNIIYTLIFPIILLEKIRSILFTINLKKLSIIFISILFIILNIKYYLSLNILFDNTNIYRFICSFIIPIIANNLLYNYLVFKNYYPLPFYFQFINILLIVFLPILPSLDWFMLGTFRLVKTIIIYILFKFKKLIILIKYALIIILVIILINFMLGKYRFEALAILSNSMSPVYNRGDVLIYEKLNKEELDKLPLNTIIIYEVDNKYIAHRIIDKEDNYYITKGDNNNVKDYKKVSISMIKGIYKFHIKYLGYPSIYINECFNKN